MLFFVVLAFVNGVVNIINKMINLQAKKALGTANGTLINYIEGTVISLAIVLATGTSHDNFTFLAEVPPLYFLGGLFGLVSMVLVLAGMARTRISYSTVVVLIGQLGTGLVLDAVLTGTLKPLKVVGILLVIAGVFWDKAVTERMVGGAHPTA